MPDPKDVRQLVASMLLGDIDRSRDAALEISKTRQMENAVALAGAWRVVPQLRRRIEQWGIDIDSTSRATLASLGATAAAQSALVCNRAGAALAALRASGIRAATFKGAGNIASLYCNASLRMLNDADILIELDDLERATAALGKSGFKPAISIPFKEWMKLLKERVYRAHDFLDFEDESGVRLDIHWRLRSHADGLTVKAILDRSQAHRLGRSEVLTVSPEDSIVLTAHHVIRERFAPSSAVKDMLDIQSWIEASPPRVNIPALASRAHDAGLNFVLLAILESISRLSSSSSVAAAGEQLRESASRDEVKQAGQLSSLFADRLQGAPASDVAIGLAGASPALIVRFIVSRMKSLGRSSYATNKFVGDSNARMSQEVKTFLRDLMWLSPSRISAYRTLGRALRQYN